MVKTITVGEILNPKEMKEALKLYKIAERHKFAERCAAEIIRPAIKRINKNTGQENDPMYLAYCVEFSIRKSQGWLDA